MGPDNFVTESAMRHDSVLWHVLEVVADDRNEGATLSEAGHGVNLLDMWLVVGVKLDTRGIVVVKGPLLEGSAACIFSF